MKPAKPKKDTLEAALEYARRRLPTEDGHVQVQLVVRRHYYDLTVVARGRDDIGLDFCHCTASELPAMIRRAVRLARKEAGV